MMRRLERGQTLVEVAFAVPVLVILVAGVVAVGRVGLAQMGASAAVREAARAAAQASTAPEARAQGLAVGRQVAAGYGLGGLQLQVEVGSFARAGEVRATARMEIPLADLPLLRERRVTVAAEHAEPIEPYRSRWNAPVTGGGGGR